MIPPSPSRQQHDVFLISDADLSLLAEGRHLRPYLVLGAHPLTLDGVAGTRFAVWAPNARRVSVVGDFNGWDGRSHPMRLRQSAGVWECFVPGVGIGALYQYEIEDLLGQLLPLKADPCGLAAQLRPQPASRVAPVPPPTPASAERRRANAPHTPVSIYEVHLASWRRRPEEGDRWLNWDELAAELIPYALDMGFTHLELLPVTEYPFDGCWGYQPIGLFAPTSRYGDPQGLARFVAQAHAQGLGVLLDWVPAHFPTDPHGLGRFDGTALYEQSSRREGSADARSAVRYDLGRAEVRSFLVANALYWLERYGVDGLRVDALASLLYHPQGPSDRRGGRENQDAVAFLQRLNDVLAVQRPEAITIAEDASALAAVSHPTAAGGLGFHAQWNRAWTQNLLRYFSREPQQRRHHHQELTARSDDAYGERFVLPLSHDEVATGQTSLLARMPGDRWQQFANLRALYGYLWGHPGRKLLFMGCEFAQQSAWNHDRSLDWHLLHDGLHAGTQQLVRDLNRVLRHYPALHARDDEPEGFEWLEPDDAQRSVYAFARHGREDGQLMLVVSNLTPTLHRDWRLGVPRPGRYQERLNTDSVYYGGSNAGTPWGVAGTEPIPAHGRAHSVLLTLPPLATVFLEWTA